MRKRRYIPQGEIKLYNAQAAEPFRLETETTLDGERITRDKEKIERDKQASMQLQKSFF